METMIRILAATVLLLSGSTFVSAQDFGSIRGVVMDGDFDAPIEGASVSLVGTEIKVTTDAQGNYVIPRVPSGTYTMIFSKSGFIRRVRSKIPVSSGQVTIDVELEGEYTDMPEFVVQEALDFSGGSEAELLNFRFESPALLNSIGSDLISKAGASDAAGALRFVAGASTRDGKSAVIRGLPDRYVSSQLNGVRLPSADDKKRAVELDQFPAAVIESLQISKTFTPDQQGDASGGAVNVMLRGIPDEPFYLRASAQYSINTQVVGENDFLSYADSDLDFFGKEEGRNPQMVGPGNPWVGSVGVMTENAPIDYKGSISVGASHEFDNGLRIGGFANVFYERDSSFYDRGKDLSFWVLNPGEELSPRLFQDQGGTGDFRTGLFDSVRGSKQLQLGMLASAGAEWEGQEVGITYLFSRSTEDQAILLSDTTSKFLFFPGFDPENPNSPGHVFDPNENSDNRFAAPFIRLETLDYQERTTETLQINGRHEIPVEFEMFKNPEITWVAAFSEATSRTPDRRQFGSIWVPGKPEEIISIPFVGDIVVPAQAAAHRVFRPAANFNFGNVQRIFKDLEETSDQFQLNVKLPFEQWAGLEGFVKFGYFQDTVKRQFNQATFTNAGNGVNAEPFFEAEFEVFWSNFFPDSPDNIFNDPEVDFSFDGEQEISAWYAMIRLPLLDNLTVTAGVRIEDTKISTEIVGEANTEFLETGDVALTALDQPGQADANFEQDDLLPAIGIEWKPFDEVTVRGAFSMTLARQTFRELTPLLQQEFLGGPTFIGNRELVPAQVTNYDLRLDYTPYDGGLVSFSWFHKDLIDPIEIVQATTNLTFDFSTAVNYPKGSITGIEFETKQDLGFFIDALEGFSFGFNCTFIFSEVEVPEQEFQFLNSPGVQVPITRRDATDAPESLYNIYLNWEQEDWGTSATLFFSFQGDTLLRGAGVTDGQFVPNIYQEGFGLLNFTLTQELTETLRLRFQAKNLTNPNIRTIYRSEVTTGDTTETSRRAGVELSLTLTGEFRF